MDRRTVLVLAAATCIAPFLSRNAGADLSPGMAAGLESMRRALSEFATARLRDDVFRQHCADAGWVEQDWFWDWYEAKPVRVAYLAALNDARSAVETVFMTTPQTGQDEDAVMEAIDAYRQIAPSGFAVQCARDLFTPKRFQAYSHEADRRWLLSEPDEVFEKSPMPDFLLRIRAARRTSSIV